MEHTKTPKRLVWNMNIKSWEWRAQEDTEEDVCSVTDDK